MSSEMPKKASLAPLQQVVHFPIVGDKLGVIASIGVLDRDHRVPGATPLQPGWGLFGNNQGKVHDILMSGRLTPAGAAIHDRQVVVNLRGVPDTGVQKGGMAFDGSSFGLALVIADFLALHRAGLQLPGIPAIDQHHHIVATGRIDGEHQSIAVRAISRFGDKLACLEREYNKADSDANWVFLYPEANQPEPGSPEHTQLEDLKARGLRCHGLSTWNPATLEQDESPPEPPPEPPDPCEETNGDRHQLPAWLCPEQDCLVRLGLLTVVSGIAATLLGLAVVVYH